MRSMQDFLSPFSYVCLAGGPGRSPFSIYHPLFSHVSMSHFALMPTTVSSLCLEISVSPILGWRFPIQAFQSPQITDLSCGGICPRMSSTSFLAESSSMPRVCKFVVGGRYTFPIHIVSPPCPYMPKPWAYSFPTYLRIFIPFFTNTATPPLLVVAHLSSYTRYPGISSCTVDFCNHVSWTHSMSRLWVSRTVFSLK